MIDKCLSKRCSCRGMYIRSSSDIPPKRKDIRSSDIPPNWNNIRSSSHMNELDEIPASNINNWQIGDNYEFR